MRGVMLPSWKLSANCFTVLSLICLGVIGICCLIRCTPALPSPLAGKDERCDRTTYKRPLAQARVNKPYCALVLDLEVK
jgi:hypothetical protein